MPSSKFKNKKVMLVGLCALVYFVSYFSRKDFAAVMAGMISGNIIDKVTGGFIGMGLFICYGVGQLISGYLGDKIKPKYLILFGLGTTALCNLLMPLIPSGTLMIPVWALNGFAQAMLWPPIVRILSDNLDHKEFVSANLVVTTAAHISTILLYIYVPVCLEFFEWKTVFFTATALALFAIAVFVVALSFIIPNEPKKDEAKKEESAKVAIEEHNEGYFALLRKSGILTVFVCIIMMGFLRDGIETWLPTLYSEAFNRDASESILVSVALPIFSIVSITAITALHKTKLFANEVCGSTILFVICIALCVPIFLLISVEHVAARIACLILAAAICACMHGCNFLLISCLPGRFSRFGKAATTSGFCNSFTYVGAAISMYGMAIISEIYGWKATIISWAAVAALGMICTLISFKSYTSFIKQDN